MRFVTASFAALVVSLFAIVPANAGWDNVFQPTFFFRKQQTSTSGYCCPQPVVVQSSPVVVAQASPCPQPCPQPCTTRYVQRSYYQPVTVMETRTVQEAVTTYRTSYYYEPVTSFRYSYFYDPCNCSYQQVATPTTSYQLREQKCPVQSWVSRCVQVPVTGYQKVDYWQPQTTCCTTTEGPPVYQQGPPAYQQTPPPPGTGAPPLMTPINPEKPRISTTIEPSTNPKPNMYEQYYPPIEKNGSPMPSTSQPKLGQPIPVQQPSPQPPVKLDRITSGQSTVEGQVVRADKSPKAGARVLFVNASTGQRQTTTTNSGGRFHAELATGSWHVYVYGANDLAVYQTRVDVSGGQFRQVSLIKSE